MCHWAWVSRYSWVIWISQPIEYLLCSLCMPSITVRLQYHLWRHGGAHTEVPLASGIKSGLCHQILTIGMTKNDKMRVCKVRHDSTSYLIKAHLNSTSTIQVRTCVIVVFDNGPFAAAANHLHSCLQMSNSSRDLCIAIHHNAIWSCYKIMGRFD